MKYKYLLFFFVSLLYVVCFNTSVLGQTAKPLTGDALTLKHNTTYANPSSGFSTIFIDSGVVKVQRSDGTTKAAIFLTDLSATSPLSYNNSTGAFSLAGLSSLGTANYVVGVNSGATAWEYKQLIAGTNVTITPGANSYTFDVAGTVTNFNDIGDATATGTINLVSYAQELTANSLAGATALKISSTSTAAASNTQRLFEVANSGANSNSTQTTYSIYATNTKTGTSSTNVAGYFSASGATNNYGLIVAAGMIGAGTTAPLAPMDFGTASGDKIFLYGSNFERIGFGLSSTTLRIFSEANAGRISLGFQAVGSPFTYTERVGITTVGSIVVTQPTLTSSAPVINSSVTLNSGATTFQLFKINATVTAAASASTFIDLQSSSTSRFKVDLSGQITTNEGNGIVHNLGYLKVGHFFDAGTGYAGVANAAMTDLNNDYALLQEGLGATFLNAKSGKTISFRLGNSELGLLSGTKWDFTAATSGVAKRTPYAAKTTTYSVATTDSGTVLTNVGAGGSVTFNLPAAAAGLEYHFYITDAQDFVVDAAGTDTIRLAGSESASGGNLTANTVGNALTIRYVASGKWGVFSSTGTWTVN